MFLRRGILSPIVVAKWALSKEELTSLQSDVWTWSNIVLACRRGLDFVSGAVAAIAKHQDAMTSKVSTEAMDQEDNEAESNVTSAAAVQMQEELVQLRQQLAEGIESCRMIFSLLSNALVAMIAERALAVQRNDGEVDLDSVIVTALSLVKLVAHEYSAAQRHLNGRAASIDDGHGSVPHLCDVQAFHLLLNNSRGALPDIAMAELLSVL